MKTPTHHRTELTFDSPHSDSAEGAHTYETEKPFKYELLGECNESTGRWISGEKLRMDYLHLTDNLIHKITDGVEVIDDTTGEKEKQPYSTVVFLDKSARPLSHLVREAWPHFAKNVESGEVPTMPDFKFLNIDRRQYIDQLDKNGSGIIEIDRIDQSFIWSLRSAFLTPEGKRQIEEGEGLTEEVENMTATLDNKNILVVDETFYSGDTVKIATRLLQRAFPTAHIDGTHWMKEKVGGFSRNPVWYSEALMGRGVSNRYAELGNHALKSIPDDNFYAKKSGHFISSPHWRKRPGLRDSQYYQLIQEIKELTSNPDVPIMPSLGRDEEDLLDRIVAYNYDANPSELTPDQKDALIQEVIVRKNTIDEVVKQRKHY